MSLYDIHFNYRVKKVFFVLRILYWEKGINQTELSFAYLV